MSSRKEWFVPNPDCPEGGYLISMEGTLFLILQEAYQEGNDRAKGHAAIIFAELKRRGYGGERMVRRAFQAKKPRLDIVAGHVENMFAYISKNEFAELMQGIWR